MYALFWIVQKQFRHRATLGILIAQCCSSSKLTSIFVQAERGSVTLLVVRVFYMWKLTGLPAGVLSAKKEAPLYKMADTPAVATEYKPTRNCTVSALGFNTFIKFAYPRSGQSDKNSFTAKRAR